MRRRFWERSWRDVGLISAAVLVVTGALVFIAGDGPIVTACAIVQAAVVIPLAVYALLLACREWWLSR